MQNNLSQTKNLTSVFGDIRSREDILKEINSNNTLSELFNGFSATDRERILLFLEGKHSLQILNDRFFQRILRPDISFERIESLLSAVFGQPVKVSRSLSRDGCMISEEGSLVVMDIIVKLSDGSMANVEMQRVGYLFPGERTNCYLADMIMRQYNSARSESGKDFSYKDMRPVRLIVIMDRSSSEFKKAAPAYRHIREVTYDSGASVTDLENVVYFSLDTYRESVHNEINTSLDAWLTFFSYEDPEHVIKLIEKYPEFLPMYQDIAEFRQHPGEVIGMFSEALRIMDRNTTQYWLDGLNKTISEQKQTISDQADIISDQNQTIEKQSEEIYEYKQEISAYESEILRLKALVADQNDESSS